MAEWRLPFPDSALTGHFGKIRTFKGAPSNPHRGTDWAPTGSSKGKTAIPAITDGTIKLIQYSKILGWVVVQTGFAEKKTWFIGYCHLKCNKCGINCKGGHDASEAIKLKVGDKISAGDAVAVLGNSGSASSGCHLHATLSDTLKGVFAGNVYDLHAFITKQQAKPAKKAAPQVTQHEHECKHCGKVFK